MGKFTRGVKVGVVLGALGAVLVNKKARREIAVKLRALQKELEQKAEQYGKKYPQARVVLEKSKKLKGELGKHAKHFEEHGEKVASTVAKEAREAVREASELITKMKQTSVKPNAAAEAKPRTKKTRTAKSKKRKK